MSEPIVPEVIEPDDEMTTVFSVTGPDKETRIALIRAHSRLAIAKQIVGGVGAVAFFGFLATCVYATCGGG